MGAQEGGKRMKIHKETLDDIIENSGLKLEAIAKRMEISSNYLWRKRNKPETMDIDFVVRLAEVLSVDVDRLIESIKK